MGPCSRIGETEEATFAQIARIMYIVTGFFHKARSLVPSGFGSGNNVGGNITNGFVVQTSSEGGHGVLSVGHLRDNGLDVTSTGKVGLKGLLLKGLFGHDHILSSGVA